MLIPKNIHMISEVTHANHIMRELVWNNTG